MINIHYVFRPNFFTILTLRSRKAGRVLCGGARETH